MAMPQRHDVDNESRSTDPRIVLILEDDVALASLLEILVADYSVSALVFSTAESGLEWIKANPGQLRLLISDVNLAGKMTGDAIASLVLAERPETPVILISGNPPREDFPACKFLRKPIHIEQLLAAMSALI